MSENKHVTVKHLKSLAGKTDERLDLVEDDVERIDAFLPDITANDEGSYLRVVDGKLQYVPLNFSKIYVGSAEPTADFGEVNDLYIQLDETPPTTE